MTNAPEQIEYGVPFTGELIRAGMVVTVFDNAESLQGRSIQIIKHGEHSDDTEVVQRCYGTNDSQAMGIPILIQCLMYPYAIVHDDMGNKGSLDLRNKRFILVEADYRTAFLSCREPPNQQADDPKMASLQQAVFQLQQTVSQLQANLFASHFTNRFLADQLSERQPPKRKAGK